jgi:hypothetical protein
MLESDLRQVLPGLSGSTFSHSGERRIMLGEPGADELLREVGYTDMEITSLRKVSAV